MSQNLPSHALTRLLIQKRLGQGQPEVVTTPFGRDIFLLETHVAGIRHHQAEDACQSLAKGASLRLQREPDNPHDELAIEIYSPDKLKLGYIPRFRNPVLARLMDAGKTLLAEVASIARGEEAYGNDDLEIRLNISLREY